MIVIAYVMAEICHRSIVVKNLTQISSVSTLLKQGPGHHLGLGHSLGYELGFGLKKKPFKNIVETNIFSFSHTVFDCI